MQAEFTTNLVLQNSVQLEKLFVVYGKNEKDMLQKLNNCLDFNVKVKEWRIKDKKLISMENSIDEEKMYGVWYEPF